MPTYGYQCTECQHEFSIFQAMKDQPIATCPECNGHVKRLLYPVGIVFKGSGWYINDSRQPERSESDGNRAEANASTEKSAQETKDQTTKDQTTKETNAEPKSEAKSEPAPAAAKS